MDEELTCPRAMQRKPPPRGYGLMDEACDECPALLKQVDERGLITYHCRVYRNRFRSAGAAVPLTVPQPTRASWSRERLDRR
jgi:hypothetical protein